MNRLKQVYAINEQVMPHTAKNLKEMFLRQHPIGSYIETNEYKGVLKGVDVIIGSDGIARVKLALDDK